MRTVVIRSHGGPEVLALEDRPVPEPGPRQVRVRVRAAALNHLDLWVRRGIEGHPFPLPMVPGCDGAGVVDALGAGATGCAVGDRVALAPGISCGICRACASGRDPLCAAYGILGETRDGTDAEYVVVPDANLLPMPGSMSFATAAAAPLAFLTAWAMLVDRAGLRPGETLLVQAGASGVGSAAIQIGRLWGARVFATGTTAEKRARCLELGAELAFDSSRPGTAKEVKRATGGSGAEVVFEHVGAATFEESMRSLGKAGRLVTCGATTGHQVRIDLRHVFFKSLSILGSTMGGLGTMREVWGHLCAGRLAPILDRSFPLAEVAEAHRHLEAGRQFGKVVLLLE